MIRRVGRVEPIYPTRSATDKQKKDGSQQRNEFLERLKQVKKSAEEKEFEEQQKQKQLVLRRDTFTRQYKDHDER